MLQSVRTGRSRVSGVATHCGHGGVKRHVGHRAFRRGAWCGAGRRAGPCRSWGSGAFGCERSRWRRGRCGLPVVPPVAAGFAGAPEGLEGGAVGHQSRLSRTVARTWSHQSAAIGMRSSGGQQRSALVAIHWRRRGRRWVAAAEVVGDLATGWRARALERAGGHSGGPRLTSAWMSAAAARSAVRSGGSVRSLEPGGGSRPRCCGRFTCSACANRPRCAMAMSVGVKSVRLADVSADLGGRHVGPTLRHPRDLAGPASRRLIGRQRLRSGPAGGLSTTG